MHAIVSKILLLQLRLRSFDDDEKEDASSPWSPGHQGRRPRRRLTTVAGSTMKCCNRNGLLIITTSICACASFAFLCVAIATDYWLHMQERVQDENETVTYMNTSTGLWKKCVYDVRKSPIKQCSYISYFAKTDRDGLGPTRSILLSMRRSTIFPLISLLILLTGEILCFIGHCNHRKKILTFVSGILFVIGGLVTLIGIIIFIGAITEEVGNKGKSSIEKPRFLYQYGSSFILTIGSFIVSEVTGVLSVYLYISRYKHAYRKQQEHVTILSANEQASLANNANMSASRLQQQQQHNCKPHDHGAASSPVQSENYYTYTPIADFDTASKEASNYTLARDQSKHTVSTLADTHISKDCSVHSVRDMDSHRRTTPV